MTETDGAAAERSLEQQARDLLGRAGVADAGALSAGDLVEIANVLNERAGLRETVANVADAVAEHCAREGDADFPQARPLGACVAAIVRSHAALREAALAVPARTVSDPPSGEPRALPTEIALEDDGNELWRAPYPLARLFRAGDVRVRDGRWYVVVSCAGSPGEIVTVVRETTAGASR